MCSIKNKTACGLHHAYYLHGTCSRVRCIMDVINARSRLAPDRRPSSFSPGLKLLSTFIVTETCEDQCHSTKAN